MSQKQHEFTFIDVNAEKGQNSRKIKSHASTQINRQKRQRAVAEYQQLLLQGSLKTEASASTSASQAGPGKDVKDIAHPPNNLPGKLRADEDGVVSRSEEEGGQCDPRPDSDPDLDEARKTCISRTGPWPSYREWFVGYQIKRPSSSPSNTSATGNSEETSPGALTLYLAPIPHQTPGPNSTPADQQSAHVPRIDPLLQQDNPQWALKTIKDFIQHSYESKWREAWQNMDWYDDEDHELGIWRECFTLAVEFLRVGKVKGAFSLINAGLSATPKFLKAEHPGLLLALLKIMAVCSDIQDERLRSMIRYHLVQLTVVTLEDSHPILQIMKGQLNEGRAPFYHDDVLSLVMVDAVTEAFGTLHFLPVSMQFRMICRLIEKGKYDEAVKVVELVANAWGQTQTPTSPFLNILKVEKAKLQVARHEMTAAEFEKSIEPAIQQLDSVRTARLNTLPRENGQAVKLNDEQLALLSTASKQFMMRAYYALSLHMHAHINEMFDLGHHTDPLDISHPDTLTFPTMICRVMLRELRDEAA